MAIGTEHLDGGAVFVVTINPDAEWSYSKFPHPLITVDYDAEGNPFKIIAVGSKAKELGIAVKERLLGDLHKENTDAEVVGDLDDALVAV
jgi:hypothetical protein